MSNPWFRPKRLGVGAVPVTWQGWAMTLGLIVYVLVLGWLFIEKPELAGQRVDLGGFILWAALTLGGVVVYMIVAWQKTSEPWFWRWDKRGEE